MNLSLRLSKVLDFLENSNILLDIGSDHAYLPIAFVNKFGSKAYAVDNKIGPLENAKKNIKESLLENKIFPILSDGFMNIKNIDYDTVTITGMGGLNIIEILKNTENKFIDNKTFIFEANRDNDILRRYLSDNGYEIIDESIILEDSFYYFIIKAIKNNNKYSLNKIETLFGKHNIQSKNPLLKDYLNKLLDIYKQALKKSSSNEILINKISTIEEALNEIK